MSKFLNELSADEENETYFAVPTFAQRLGDYKQTCMDIITTIKMANQNLEDYIVPQTAILDRMGQKPKGR